MSISCVTLRVVNYVCFSHSRPHRCCRPSSKLGGRWASPGPQAWRTSVQPWPHTWVSKTRDKELVNLVHFASVTHIRCKDILVCNCPSFSLFVELRDQPLRGPQESEWIHVPRRPHAGALLCAPKDITTGQADEGPLRLLGTAGAFIWFLLLTRSCCCWLLLPRSCWLLLQSCWLHEDEAKALCGPIFGQKGEGESGDFSPKEQEEGSHYPEKTNRWVVQFSSIYLLFVLCFSSIYLFMLCSSS